MTGPEHYAKAEQLIDRAHDLRDQDEPGTGRAARADFVLARAQVHATLALAAATANQRVGLDGDQSFSGQLADAPEEYDHDHPQGGNVTWAAVTS